MPDFDTFAAEYPADPGRQAPGAGVLSRYAGKVPGELISFWKRFGFAGFSDGLFWTTNPEQLEDVLRDWVAVRGRRPPAVPVLRTAFGKVVYWHDGHYTLLDVHHNDRFDAGNDTQVLFDVFLVGEDARSGILLEPLFRKARKKLGPLERDEVYAFGLPLVLGGDRSLKNIVKAGLREQLALLAHAHGNAK